MLTADHRHQLIVYFSGIFCIECFSLGGGGELNLGDYGG